MDIQWPDGWQPTDENGSAFEVELKRELAPQHRLFGTPVKAVGYRGDSDDVLFRLCDGTQQVAEVHLTWRGRVEEDATWPFASLFDSLDEWLTRPRDDFSEAADYVLKKNEKLYKRLA